MCLYDYYLIDSPDHCLKWTKQLHLSHQGYFIADTNIGSLFDKGLCNLLKSKCSLLCSPRQQRTKVRTLFHTTSKQFALRGRGECRSGDITFMHVYLSLDVENLNNCDSELGPLQFFQYKGYSNNQVKRFHHSQCFSKLAKILFNLRRWTP